MQSVALLREAACRASLPNASTSSGLFHVKHTRESQPCSFRPRAESPRFADGLIGTKTGVTGAIEITRRRVADPSETPDDWRTFQISIDGTQ